MTRILRTKNDIQLEKRTGFNTFRGMEMEISDGLKLNL